MNSIFLRFVFLTGMLCMLLISASTAQTNRYSSSDMYSMGGFSSSIVMDGETVLVGEGGNTMTSGFVYIFSKDNMGAWSESGRLIADDAIEGDGFGTAMALNGNTLVVSAPDQNDGGGALYVFKRNSGGAWVQSSRLTTAESSSGDRMGATLAISDNSLVVGAADKFGKAGAAFVFTRDDSGAWSEGEMIVAADSASGDVFGSSVAIMGDYVFVGAPGKGKREGVVYVYSKQNGEWVELDQLSAFGLDRNNRFGSVLQTMDDMLLVSAPRILRSTGAVFLYRMDENSRWKQSGSLAPFDGTPNMRFGLSIAVSEKHVWIGAPRASRGAGAVYSFHADEDGNWTGSSKIFSEFAGSGSNYSASIAVSSTIAVAGLPGRGGSATIFENQDGSWVETAKLEGDIEAYDSITGGQTQCEDGKASRFSCDAVDMVAFLSTKDIGAPRGIQVNDVWGWTDPVTGKEYALVGRQDAMAFVDVTDAQNPVYIGELFRTEGTNPSSWRDVKVYKDHAYIVADGAPEHGVQIFDLTRLRNPQNTPIVFTEDGHYDGVGSAHNIVINESTGFAYVVGVSGSGNTCGGGLHMLNLEKPLEPVFAGCFSDSN
ncbi:MAG: choice-of-anchor B family protein, partial [Bacteroidetes bacterium]